MWKTPDYFAGKTVLVVGAASGTALIFARERAKSDSRAGPIFRTWNCARDLSRACGKE